MEQDGVAGSAADAGGAGSTAPPGAEASTSPRAPPDTEPAEGKGPAAAQAQGAGQEEPGKEKAAAAEARDAGRKEPAKEEPTGGEAEPPEKGPAAAGARDGGKEEPVKGKALPEGEPQGGTAEPTEGKVPAAAQARGAGKGEPPRKAEAAAEPQAGKAAQPAQEKGPAGAGAQHGGKEEPTEKAGGVPEAEGGGKTEPTAGKAPAVVEAEGGKAEPAEGTAQARDGAGEEPVKEKAPAAAKAQEGGKKAAKAEKTPAAKKPAKEKAPAEAKAQDGEKTAEKVEKTSAAKKTQDGGKEAPVKEKATAEEATAAAAKAQDGEKKDTKEEKAPATATAQDGGKAYPWEERPGAEVAAMEMIPEETAVAPATEGLVEPAPAQGDLRPPGQPDPAGSAGVPQERTLPGAAGQPQPQPASEPPGDAEQPGPGAAGQPSSTEGEPPPSPYLTPDFGKEDPFEILDDVPPPPAPFAHRIVTLRSANVSSQFSLSSKEILGGGKFGEVHTCTEKQTGLKLAAKVIRKQGAKDKEMVLLEIDVMNQLNHRNLIQLYDAIETPREIILFMEFIEGGELFERIVDDDYHLTEVDCMVFVRQICEGIRFMHHMRVLHLDLKPENILCVAATGHMVKIIDFGLARRYNPQEKLKVNFGTPEFLSPEVVNYEQVSYSTDMWSMGVITYMLLSGLSPFLGDNDTETLNNVLAANWYFDEEAFEGISDEAKDFVSNLIIKEKGGRMSAGQCLQHPWLNNLAEKAKRCNRRLKSQVLLKKYVMRRRWKKNFIGVCAANRFKKITSSGSLTALGV
uniref:Myosin light chain kinase 2, skeletal/cardiac muscle n=1 Tax=Anser cygnoides TaxID=8845 RepID=A0A8B9DB03_ANSCY